MKLVIGDKNYSSWSMRPWLVLKHFGIPFEEIVVELGGPQTKAAILTHSPSGRVPCLITDDGVSVWDSLAIVETLAERFPQHAMWPRDPAARARARSTSAEMHGGFMDLRSNMWMNIRASFPGKNATAGVLADIARIDAMWREYLDTYGGPFLFGEFGIADAMYAPVVMRFNTWQPALSEVAAAYARRVTEQPAVAAWIAAALAESHRIDYYETCE
jgi:glutathione S-transferase